MERVEDTVMVGSESMDEIKSNGGSSDAGEGGEEEEEWAGATGDTTTPSVADRGAKLSRPPTGEELRAIKDAAELFRSGSFKLQVGSCLSIGLKMHLLI
jgi:U3 small nucleolar RNA-associated protein 22